MQFTNVVFLSFFYVDSNFESEFHSFQPFCRLSMLKEKFKCSNLRHWSNTCFHNNAFYSPFVWIHLVILYNFVYVNLSHIKENNIGNELIHLWEIISILHILFLQRQAPLLKHIIEPNCCTECFGASQHKHSHSCLFVY